MYPIAPMITVSATSIDELCPSGHVCLISKDYTATPVSCKDVQAVIREPPFRWLAAALDNGDFQPTLYVYSVSLTSYYGFVISPGPLQEENGVKPGANIEKAYPIVMIGSVRNNFYTGGPAMTQKSINQDISSLYFYENVPWRFFSSALWDGLIVVLLVIAVLVGGMPSEKFWVSANIQNITWVWLTAALLVSTMSLIIASGGIDLSVGSVAGLTAAIIASRVVSEGASIEEAFIFGLGVAFLVGLVNGFLIGVIKLNPVIVTLAMMTILRGVCYTITNGQSIAVAKAGFLSSLAIPGVVLILLIIVCIIATELKLVNSRHLILLNKASWIRQSFLIGLPYILSSTMAGFVGALYLGRFRAALPTIGTGLEVDAILMVLLGGTPLAGGFVNIVGAVLAALVVAIVQNASALNGVSQFSVATGKGVALLIFGLLCHAYYYIVSLIFTKRKSRP